ncbi:Histone acetyltransferase type B subunit 2 [Mucor velutinosus]|uniref:Histone acetyltransferase type B subunit 2 n=1 Tax=Mucor velutinosus TaxID=708070 RepID=A0AAN7DH83_9FUNG|nr:Histone acetyltransferase type B subunit 2 [Mucor velutinosus]
MNTTSSLQKRRSKSLDNIIIRKKGDRLSCYQDTFTSTSPIVAIHDLPPKRRHSIHEPHQRLATIYGWVTTAKSSHSMHESNRRLHTSQSFSHIPAAAAAAAIEVDSVMGLPDQTTNKLSKMLEKTKNISLLFPNKTITGISSDNSHSHYHHHHHHHHHPRQHVDQILLDPMQQQHQNDESWVQPISTVQTLTSLQHADAVVVVAENRPPPLPIENDPHIFDLLAKDTSRFIHYGKSDATITSATVEKLIEKLTREMDNEFIMDFFLTFRQFLTPIKLCKLLILRFRWALLQDDDERRLIRIRTFVVIRHWLTHYWTYDFTTSRTLRYVLSTFLTQLQSNPVILASPRDDRIVKNLRNVLKRQRKFYQQRVDPLQQQEQDENGKLPSRKDSAIGISSCRNSLHLHHHPDSSAHSNTPVPSLSSWTTKMKRSLKRTVSIRQSQSNATARPSTLYSTVNNAPCSCHLTDCSLSTSSSVSLNNIQHKEPCTMRPSFTRPPPALHTTNRFFRASNASTTTLSHYKSIVLKYRSEVIAQQFCLIERAMLQNVTWDELVDLRWRKRSAQRKSFVIEMTTLDDDVPVGVDQMIGFFNMTCQWVASEIVRSQQLDTRVKVIEKFLRIALKCYHHRNYSTLMQILLGLQSPAVSRLERTWQKVDHCQMELFNQLKEMAKPFRNWKNVRDCMTKATEEVAESFAVESVLTGSLKEFDNTHGCIPFLGLYLSDLVFVAELPTFIGSALPDEEEEEEDTEQLKNDDTDLCERLSHHLVNYNKFRITASVVKHVLAFQVLSRAYNFKVHPTLHTHLRSIRSLDNADIRKASFLCEE